MQDSSINVSIARVIAGLGFIGLGILALLGSMGVVDFLDIWNNFWSVGLIVAGLLVWLANSRSWLWATIIAGVGVVALVNIHTELDFNLWTLVWPVVMVAIGLSIIFRSPRSSKHKLGEISDSQSDQFALLSGNELRVMSDNYTGGKITAVMGGVDLDLSHADIKKDAVLDVFVLMGGAEIKVPAGVKVRSDAGAVLGGVEVKSDPKAGKNAPTLVLTGTIVMGGVEVKH